MRRQALLVGALCALAASAASAQPLGVASAEVRWDSLGPGEGRRATSLDLNYLAIQSGPGGPLADTLFAVDGGNVYRLAPDEAHFGARVNETLNPSPGNIYHITAAGTHLTEDRGVARSTDGGVTWTRATMVRDGVEDGSVVRGFFESETYGLLGAGQGGFLWQSTDDGQRWDVLHDFEIGFSNAYAVAELAGDTRAGAEPSPWAGRLLVGFRGEIRTSDDGGQTWTDATRLVNTDWDQLIESPSGVVYAASRFYHGIYASRDGGATWALLKEFSDGEFLDGWPQRTRTVVGSDGTLWVGLSAVNSEPLFSGTFVVSRDGGRTWTEEAEGFGPYEVNDLAFDSAGRLVAATRVGVWRTAAPVVVVGAEEAPPSEPSEAALGAPYPNPTTGDVTVMLSLPAATEVRVAVYDVLGREVAVLANGRLGAGAHTFDLETINIAAGVYVVRAAAEGHTGTTVQRFSVVR